MQNCVFLYLELLLLHRIGNLLAYVAALLVASFGPFEFFVAEWLVMRLKFVRSQI